MTISSKHNHSIDILKGWAIIAVILGHIFMGSAEESLPRYIIYSFHMPLFFFISGYLLNMEKIGAMTISNFLKKYVRRMLAWWFVAWIVYTICVNLLHSGHVISDYETPLHFLIRNLVFPWGHLWFVPGLFTTITVAFLIQKWGGENWAIMLLMTISIIQMCLSYSGLIPNSFFIRYHNFLFFSLGLILKRLTISMHPKYEYIVISLYFCVLLLIRYIDAGVNASMLSFTALLGFMIFGIAPLMQNDSLTPSPIMEWLGRNSLQIYLWHEMPVVVLKSYFENDLMIYYAANFVCLGLIIIFAWYRVVSNSKRESAITSE